jgi:thiamine pyrophosphate-dependent acetolactate synthase large subunit-like protein
MTELESLSRAKDARPTVAQALAQLLEPCVGVGGAFNVAGSANVPFIVSWSARKLSWTTALEEKRGLLMAEGYARASGRLALMTATSGPGVTNLATALLLALRERSPLFVVAGQTPRTFAARLPVQELDTRSFARDLTLHARELSAPEQLEGFVGELLRAALRPEARGPVLLAVPSDLWQQRCAPPRVIRLPQPWSREAARRCAEALERAVSPVIIAGNGVIQAQAAGLLLNLVELLPRAHVVTTPRALGAFSPRHSRSAGVMGFGGGTCAEIDSADLILVLGSRLHEMSTSFDERLFAKNIIQVDIDSRVLGQVYPADGYCAELSGALADLISELDAFGGSEAQNDCVPTEAA